MHDVSLALVWHQHQPYYPDDVAGDNLMPWVRLHGVKDYYGMALHLKEVPEFRCTINLVPSLLVQIRKYAEGAEDRHLSVSRIPADSLSEEDALYILDHFFMANPDQMIRPFARYYDLYLRRALGTDTAKNALRRFRKQDLRDLQVWSNLTWLHPLVLERDPELKALRDKGKHYTEAEKQMLLDKQLHILAQVIPLHKELADSGQVELTTTPFYHPILPLLWDKRSAREALPRVALPRHLASYKEDAEVQVRRAVEYHEKLFGRRPVGMWPSEGSVSHDLVPLWADAGIQWVATDEEILSCSTDGFISRDARGYVRHPEMMYRPWYVEQEGRRVQIVFRDHALSDLIGFHYQRTSGTRAADDFISRLEAIGSATHGNGAQRRTLVAVILDGENCWEYYPGGGVEFLRSLYQRTVAHPRIEPVRVCDYLARYPATDRLNRLFSGSWINHNFAIWIGHHEDNTAWDLLHETREHLRRAEQLQRHPREQLDRAWEELYIAEGSDWFWWFGDDHSSAQDGLFDYLFRKHLQNVYLVLGELPPPDLSRVITRSHRKSIHTTPLGFLSVKVDGRRTFFEWINAGRYSCQSERGTMTMVTEGPLCELYFGFDRQRFLLRVDTQGHARATLGEAQTLRVGFLEPRGYELLVARPGSAQPEARLCHDGSPLPDAGIEAAADQVIEIAVPFERLGLAENDPIHFFVELVDEEQSLDRAPREGAIELTTPSPHYEQIMWQV